MTTSPRLAIVGTAGRDRHQHLSRALFLSMVNHARGQLQLLTVRHGAIQVVSGGAAWADHVAVALQHHDTHLFLPAAWDGSRGAFQDTGVRDWRTNPGGTSNHWHRAFQATTGIPSLLDIGVFVMTGRTTTIQGFHERNKAVAQSEYLLAYTWGEGDVPADGGTSHTWGCCTGQRCHIPLSRLVVPT